MDLGWPEHEPLKKLSPPRNLWFRGSEGSIGSIGSLVPRVPSERRFSRFRFRFRWFPLRGFRFFEGSVVPLFRCSVGSVLQLFRYFHYVRTRRGSRGVDGYNLREFNLPFGKLTQHVSYRRAVGLLNCYCRLLPRCEYLPCRPTFGD